MCKRPGHMCGFYVNLVIYPKCAMEAVSMVCLDMFGCNKLDFLSTWM